VPEACAVFRTVSPCQWYVDRECKELHKDGSNAMKVKEKLGDGCASGFAYAGMVSESAMSQNIVIECSLKGEICFIGD